MTRAGLWPRLFHLIAQLLSLLFDLLSTRCRSDQHKDLEILLLRQQWRILQRHHLTTPQLSRWEKLELALLAARFAGLGHWAKSKLNQVLLLFKPDTVLKWHRDVVRRKWSFDHRPKRGRPTTDPDLQALLLRLAQENPSWGYSKLPGELLKPQLHHRPLDR
jgi:hypothetical protein